MMMTQKIVHSSSKIDCDNSLEYATTARHSIAQDPIGLLVQHKDKSNGLLSCANMEELEHFLFVSGTRCSAFVMQRSLAVRNTSIL